MRTMVLASSSPQRSALLRRLRLPFVTMRPDIDEETIHDGPEDFARLIARNKARAVHERILSKRSDARRDAVSSDSLLVSRLIDGGGLWIVGADTVIDLDNEILGKAEDARHARSMLQRLSGRTHVVITGMCLLVGFPTRRAEPDEGPPVEALESVRTKVRFGELTRREIDGYIASDDWRDAAGAYRIQSLGSALVEGIVGSYTNVVGLPLRRFCGMLRRYGYFET